MEVRKLSLIVALLSLTMLLVPSAFANDCDGVTITKEIINTCEYPSDPTCGLGIYPDEPYVWYVMITVTNLGDETMMDVYLKDRFGGEFAVAVVEGAPPTILTTHGKTAKVFLDFEFGDLAPGDSFSVILEVSTDINPGGRPEFTSCGCYEMNSGATVQWVGGSASTGPIIVTTY